MDQNTQRTILRQDFIKTIRALEMARLETHKWLAIMHPRVYRQIQWMLKRPEMRRLYRAKGYPFGRNQGAFKRWVMIGDMDA